MSQSFADESYNAEIDRMIGLSGGPASPLEEYAGKFAVSVKAPVVGQSGRLGAPSGHAPSAAATRLILCDTELMPDCATVCHRTSLFACNRADDVAEVLAAIKAAQTTVNTVLDVDHGADPETHSKHVPSMICLRKIHENGSMHVFPIRSMFAAASGPPETEASPRPSPQRSCAPCLKALDSWARHGGWLPLAAALYEDALEFFWDWLPKEKVNDEPVRLSRKAIEASPAIGGLGIAPPGDYYWDYTNKSDKHDWSKDVANTWNRTLEKDVSRLTLNTLDTDDDTDCEDDVLSFDAAQDEQTAFIER